MPFVKEGAESNPEILSLYKEINDELQIGKIPNILKGLQYYSRFTESLLME